MKKTNILIAALLALLGVVYPANGQTSRSGRITQGPLAAQPNCTVPASPGDFYVATDQTPVQVSVCSSTGWTSVGGLVGGGIIGSLLTASSPTASVFQVGGVPLGNGNAPVTTCAPYVVKADGGSPVATLDRGTLIVIQSASACTVTLPDPTTPGMGGYFPFKIMNAGAGTVTVNHGGTATFTVVNGLTTTTGATSFSVVASQFGWVNSDNGNWWVQIVPGGSSGVTNRDVTGTTSTDTVLAGDCNGNAITHKESVANATTLPTATTLGVAACTFTIANNTTGTPSDVTVTPTTWTINGNANFPIHQNQTCRLTVDGATNWKTDCAEGPLTASGNATLVRTPHSTALSIVGADNGNPGINFIYATSYGVKGGGAFTAGDGHTTSGSATVTSASAVWTPAMVGWILKGATSAGSLFPNGTTVLSVTNANTLVASQNAIGTTTAGNLGVFPQDETANITAAVNAMAALQNCGTVVMPSGASLVSGAVGNLSATPTACQGVNGQGPFPIIQGQSAESFGKGGTQIVGSPDFDFSTCTNFVPCLFNNVQIANLNINGLGLNTLPAAAQNKVLVGSEPIHDFGIYGWGSPSITGFTALSMNNGGGTSCFTCFIDNTGIVTIGNFGTFSGYVEGTSYVQISAGGQLTLLGAGTEIDGVNLNGSGAQIWCSDGQRIVGNVNGTNFGEAIRFSSSGGTAYLNGCNVIGASGQMITFAASGSVYVHNTQFTGSSGGFLFSNGAGQNFYNLGGNSYSGTLTSTTVSGLSIIAGSPNDVFGSCTGTATSSSGSAFGLYGTGPNETITTCTSATIGSGKPASGPGTVVGLYATASHAGVNGSSGVVTLLKNGATTTQTCTIGTGTACNDFAHPISYVQGDLLSLQYTTQNSEVLAGVQAVAITQ